MPSGSKRKKKSKKSTAAAGPVVIPNSKNQENVEEKVLAVAEKENEVFETLKSQLDPEDNEEVDSKEAARNETECDVIEKEVILEKIERTAEEHVNVIDEEKKPAAQIDEVEASSLDEKEIEGGLQQEEMANVNKNGDANVSSKVRSSKSIDLEMTLDDGLKSDLENRAIENEQILLVSAIPNVVQCSQEIPGQIDEDLSRSNEDIHENSGSLVAAKEAEKSSSDKTSPADKGKTEISERTEVAYGPTVRRRTTFWNCCGLFDLIASSDR